MNRYFNRLTIGTYIWDSALSNGQIDNGSGTWSPNPTNLTWVTTFNGVNLPWLNNFSATFGGNPGVGAAGIVTLVGQVTVTNLLFEPTPSGNFVINPFGSTGSVLFLTNGFLQVNQDAAINVAIISTGTNYVKRGQASLTIGSVAGNITGNVIISQGRILSAGNNILAAGGTNISLGDDATGTSNIAFLWPSGRGNSSPITVNNQGTGTVTLGTYTIPTAPARSSSPGSMNLNRPVILFDTTNASTTFIGPISGNVGTITIDGTSSPVSLGNTPKITFDTGNNPSPGNPFVGKIIVKPNVVFQINKSPTFVASTLNLVNNQPIEVNGYFYISVGANNAASIGTLSGQNTAVTSLDFNTTNVGPQTLSIGNDNGTATYNGIIRDGALNPSTNQVLNLTKEGTGIQLLTGTNTYTGPTTINNGALGGTGSLSASTTTINSNGRIMGGLGLGNSGTFTTGNLVFATGSTPTAAIDVYTNGATLSRVQVNGTCDLGTTSKINLLQTMPAGTFDIIIATGTMSGTLPTIGTNLSGRTATVSQLGNTLRVRLL